MTDLTAPRPLLQVSNSLVKKPLSQMHCGILAGTISDVEDHMPEVLDLVASCPIAGSIEDYRIDVKVHMLMPGQYPCIPNWHCDFVPRDRNNALDYSRVGEDYKRMYLLVTESPSTEFLSVDLEDDEGIPIVDHRHLASLMMLHTAAGNTMNIEPWTWYAMWRDTPHRGTQATEHGWRFLVRLVPKCFYRDMSDHSPRRIHTQVYLPANFAW